MAKYILIYYLAVNTFAFILFGMDKRKAVRHKWRISEKTLFAVSFLGGGFGALTGMRFFSHKTRHFSFRVFIPVSIAVHIVLTAWLIYRYAAV